MQFYGIIDLSDEGKVRCQNINIFQPNILVIGGGISKEGDYLLNPIKEYAKKHSYCKAVAQTDIRIASLMNDAGIIGAALACEQ